MSSELTSAALVQPAFEDMTYAAQVHHLTTCHARYGTNSLHVHRLLHELADYGRPYDGLSPAEQELALRLTGGKQPRDWDREVHVHQERR